MGLNDPGTNKLAKGSAVDNIFRGSRGNARKRISERLKPPAVDTESRGKKTRQIIGTATMPLYFFHLISPDARSADECGCELPNVESAYLEAYRAALELSFEMLQKRRDPSSLRFEVTNDSDQIVIELPFSEALHPEPRTSLAEAMRWAAA